MDKKTYLTNMRSLMFYLTVNSGADGNGDLVARTDPARKYQEIPISFSGGTMKLLFELGNLYLQGFRNRDGAMFIFKDVTYDNFARKFAYATDYGDLGLDRNMAISLDLNDLNMALDTLHNVKATTAPNTIKKPMWQSAIGLSEALRFQDVAMAVMAGTEIPSLDWAGRTKLNDYKVRVKHR